MEDELLDPHDWVTALKAFLEIAPWAPYALAIVIAALLAPNIIRAWRGGGKKND